MHVAACKTATGARPGHELADILRQYGIGYVQGHKLPAPHLKVMHDIMVCRTAALGGHIDQCDHCGHESNAYNSCRNRHCPKCQTLAKEQWIEDRRADLLPVSYFHNVFTLPHELNPLILCNKKVIFDIFFKSISDTLQTFAVDPEHKLKGQLGLIAILHTWDQTLLDHFHIHCLIPAGALNTTKNKWTHAHKDFLFPVKAISRVFRAKFLISLKTAWFDNKLIFPGKIVNLQNKSNFLKLIDQLFQKNWIVFSKKPFAGPEQVLKYLGRYTHRIAISNHRILGLNQGKVTFSYKDRSQNNKTKTMTLDAHEFIRRFLLHVLPKKYTRIRHFGFLSNRNKSKNISIVRKCLGDTKKRQPKVKKTVQEMMFKLTGQDITCCPRCKKGKLIFYKELFKVKINLWNYHDTS